MNYFNDQIESMAAYVPGAQPAPGEQVAKLNTNENPYPPSPRVRDVLDGFDPALLRRYGDAMGGPFGQAVAEHLGIPIERILPGNGSDDLIVMIARACLGPGRRVAYPSPTFGFYRTQALVAGAEIVEVPYDKSFLLPVEQLLAARAAVTFLANPDSPSGTMVGNDVLAHLATGLEGLLVVDEAYCDFAGQTALELVDRFENVICLRTLSKGYSLAGLRMGFAVARPEIIEQLAKAKQIYNVDTLAAAVAAAAIADQDYKDQCVRRVLDSRGKLTDGLAALGFDVVGSHTNFLLARPPALAPSEIVDRLKAEGILVRYFSQGVAADRIRITVGTEAENARLLAALKEILPA
jgi:histidinol-phosphate aminotransferase